MSDPQTINKIVTRAHKALARRDKAAQALALAEQELRDITREYSLAMKLWGFTPTMLRQAVAARGYDVIPAPRTGTVQRVHI